MTDNLETALRELGAHVAVPAAPDLTTAVLSRLAQPPPTRWRSRLAATALAAVLALLTAMAVSPAVRAAVYDLLRVGGVEIHENQRPPVTPPPERNGLGGRPGTLAQAREATSFPLKTPAGLGEPTTVVLVDTHMVSMAFDSPHGELRVDQFDGGLAPMFEKFVSAADVREVTVAGQRGVWVGRPHPVFFATPDGHVREESARLAANTLIWTQDGRTYRVEGTLTAREAIRVAESMR